MSLHTKAPWSIDPVDLNLITADCDGLMVADVNTEDRHHEINDANARLIAAAPDLLAALIQVHEHLRHGDNAPEIMKELCRAAIFKAKG